MGRYQEIAGVEGRAYRDHDVEYPPVLLGVIEAIVDDSDTGGEVARRVIVLALLCDLAAFAAVAWGWGERAARRYLLIGLPLLAVRLPYVRLDLVSAALAAWGLALVRRRRPTAGGLVLVLGAFTKLWPGVLLGARRRATLAGAGRHGARGAVGLAAWGAWAAATPSSGPHHAGRAGSGSSSLPGSLQAVTNAKPAFSSGAWRVGGAPALWRAVLMRARWLPSPFPGWSSWRRRPERERHVPPPPTRAATTSNARHRRGSGPRWRRWPG